MRRKTLRILTFAACLLAVSSLRAQQTGKPRIQTSAAPEETAVYKPTGKATAKAEPQAKPQNNRKDDKKAKAKPEKQKTPRVKPPQEGKRYMALKTNIAYDAIAVLNLAYEVQVHPKMTVDIPVMWSLWDAERDHALRIAALQPELRWWLGDEPGRGHFFGAHAHVAWFNAKWDENRYQDAGRPLVGGGLSYGYKLPLGEHWGAEFNIGFGYANMKYNTYYNIENGAWLNTRIRHYWGPTRLGISLVYRL